MSGPELPPAPQPAPDHHGHARRPEQHQGGGHHCHAGHEQGPRGGVEYDPSGEIKAGRGAKVLIEDYTPQADVVYRTMESGMSLGNSMVVLNQWRRAKKMTPPNISYGCMQRFV